MYILGISDSHDAGASLIKDGKIIAAVSEERLCREKFAYGFPFKSITEVLKIAKVKKEEISHIIKGGLPYPYLYSFYNTNRNGGNRSLPEIKLDEIYNSSLFHKLFINIIKKRRVYSLQELNDFKNIKRVNNASSRLTKQSLRKLGLKQKVYFIDHHYSHLASAYYTSGFDKALVFSLDFSGDNKSGMVGI
ncbi:MAG: carbamoyltransferase N-terminal domain-containing protein, partial [Nanoarchaeota archaeon]